MPKHLLEFVNSVFLALHPLNQMIHTHVVLIQPIIEFRHPDFEYVRAFLRASLRCRVLLIERDIPFGCVDAVFARQLVVVRAKELDHLVVRHLNWRGVVCDEELPVFDLWHGRDAQKVSDLFHQPGGIFVKVL